MAQDPYEVLGVARTASADDIKRAYRTLARKHHPDLNPGDTEAEARFKAANTAHALLSDPEKRARYDRGEIDADEQERRPEPPPGAGFSESGWRTYAEADQGDRYRWHSGTDNFDTSGFDDLFGDYARRARAQQNGPHRGRDAHYVLNVRFLDTVLGASRRLTLPEGHTLDVRIPPGIETGQVLRLKERGTPGHNGGSAGDALIEIIVSSDEVYTRSDHDIQLELPVTAREILLGERITIPTPHGNVAMKLPPDADTGRVMRLRGKGIVAHGKTPPGDLLVTLKVMIGPRDEKLVAALQDWTPPSNAPDPRASLWSALALSGENA